MSLLADLLRRRGDARELTELRDRVVVLTQALDQWRGQALADRARLRTLGARVEAARDVNVDLLNRADAAVGLVREVAPLVVAMHTRRGPCHDDTCETGAWLKRAADLLATHTTGDATP